MQTPMEGGCHCGRVRFRVTADLDRVKPGAPRFGALLTPQGKIIADFILVEVHEGGGGFFLDCPRALAGTSRVS